MSSDQNVYDISIDEDEQTPFIMAHAANKVRDNGLEKFLQSTGRTETQSMTAFRQAIVNEIISIIMVNKPLVKVVVSGSTTLGACVSDCDIDLLVISPSEDTDDENGFLQSLKDVMTSRGTEVRIASTPSVMVMAFFYPPLGGMQQTESTVISGPPANKQLKVDILFAKFVTNLDKVDVNQSPIHQLVKSSVISDVHSVRSFSAYRTMVLIKQSISNLSAFQNALIFIKLWARYNRIYGNYGVFGGIVWTLMLAKVSVRFPRAHASKLLYLFFLLYSNWPWPKPVVLFPLDDGPNKISPDEELLFLDKQKYLMPVIAPVYPYENMTKLVDKLSAERIKAALADGLGMVTYVASETRGWDAFFVA
ncbi:hypothetical protein ACOME3_007527 [Neoechinorhynchus agilis]